MPYSRASRRIMYKATTNRYLFTIFKRLSVMRFGERSKEKVDAGGIDAF
jgi:hypothetical protein